MFDDDTDEEKNWQRIKKAWTLSDLKLMSRNTTENKRETRKIRKKMSKSLSLGELWDDKYRPIMKLSREEFEIQFV